MPRDYFPRPDAQAITFTANFAARILAEPELYRVTPQRAAEYAQLQSAFALALRIASEPGTATKPATSVKRAARKALEAATRAIANQIRPSRDITEAQKILVGVKTRKPPSRVGKPDVAPSMHLRQVQGRTLTFDLLDAAVGIRRMPKNITGAYIKIHVGDDLPSAALGWRPGKGTSRTRVSVTFPMNTPPGAKVWATAAWMNRKSQTGPFARPVYAYVGYAITPVTPKAA